VEEAIKSFQGERHQHALSGQEEGAVVTVVVTYTLSADEDPSGITSSTPWTKYVQYERTFLARVSVPLKSADFTKLDCEFAVMTTCWSSARALPA
jgi:hypothetical protein